MKGKLISKSLRPTIRRGRFLIGGAVPPAVKVVMPRVEEVVEPPPAEVTEKVTEKEGKKEVKEVKK